MVLVSGGALRLRLVGSWGVRELDGCLLVVFVLVLAVLGRLRSDLGAGRVFERGVLLLGPAGLPVFALRPVLALAPLGAALNCLGFGLGIGHFLLEVFGRQRGGHGFFVAVG